KLGYILIWNPIGLKMLSNLKASVYIIALSLMTSIGASAETIANQIVDTSLTPTETAGIFKNISGSIGFGYESDFYEYNAADKEQSLNLELVFSLKHNDWKYGLTTLISKNLVNEEKSQFGDTKISASRPLYLFSTDSSFSTSILTSLTLPTSEVSRYEKKMYGNFSAGPTISWKNGDFNIFVLPRLGKIFNKYKTTFSGEANTSYYTKVSIAPTYQFSNSLSTQLTTSVTQGWTDNNTRKAPTYASELATELRMDTSLSLSLAIANEDKIYKSNGTSSNVKIFDKNLSVYSLTVTKEF
ncbi:MAG: hypothetical protein K2Q18_17055, partial [Bdellovibrionales bacterium]|nr:hypothetical protein [Bdellovibrionales bacterium]